MKEARDREARNVIKLLNFLFNKGYLPSQDKDSEVEQKRIKRLTYQAALRQMCDIMLQIAASRLLVDQGTVLVEKPLDSELLEFISAAADRFFAHPVWTADLGSGDRAAKVDDALKKNQSVDEAFKAVGLTAAYCAGLEKLSTNWAGK